MAGFRRAVKIENRHAENALQNFPVNDADKFVAAQNEFHRRKFYAVPLAIKRKPRAVHRIQIQKHRRPFQNFFRHARELCFRQQKRDARLVHKQCRVHCARGFGSEIGKADQAVADRRHQRRAAGARISPPALARRNGSAAARALPARSTSRGRTAPPSAPPNCRTCVPVPPTCFPAARRDSVPARRKLLGKFSRSSRLPISGTGKNPFPQRGPVKRHVRTSAAEFLPRAPTAPPRA